MRDSTNPLHRQIIVPVHEIALDDVSIRHPTLSEMNTDGAAFKPEKLHPGPLGVIPDHAKELALSATHVKKHLWLAEISEPLPNQSGSPSLRWVPSVRRSKHFPVSVPVIRSAGRTSAVRRHGN